MRTDESFFWEEDLQTARERAAGFTGYTSYDAGPAEVPCVAEQVERIAQVAQLVDEAISGPIDWALVTAADKLSGINTMAEAQHVIEKAAEISDVVRRLGRGGECDNAKRVADGYVSWAAQVLDRLDETSLAAALRASLPTKGQGLGLLAVAALVTWVVLR